MRAKRILLVLTAPLLAACSGVEPPPPGLEVVTRTNGLDLDPDGYRVTIDKGSPRTIGQNQTITFPDLSHGNHQVTLSGLADNCGAAEELSRTARVSTHGVATVTYLVTCVAISGVVEVQISTSGLDTTPLYNLQVDTKAPIPVPANGVSTISALDAGEHALRLGGVPDNCTPAGGDARAMTVRTGGITRDTARTTYDLGCVSTTGVIEVTTETIGLDADPNGYALRVDDDPPRPLATVGVTRLGGLIAGPHTILLDDVAGNCAVGGESLRTLTVTTGTSTRDTARTTFQIRCGRADQIAFSRYTTNGGWIALALSDGTSIVDLTAGSQPSWSPDGNQLVFSRVECGDYYTDPTCTGGLFTIQSDGKRLVQLTQVAIDGDAAWGPDGTIAFIRSLQGRTVLHLVHPDGTGAVPIVLSTVLGVGHPTWSPDGARIAFACEVSPGSWDICVVNRDGTSLHQLTNDPWYDGSPAWSPDGQRIAFMTNREVAGIEDDIAVMGADGSAFTLLTPGAYPAWSRDGSKIAFGRWGGKGLFVMNPDGTGLTHLTTGQDYDPSWRP